MPHYHYEAHRSTKPEDQTPGINCGLATIRGEFESTSANAAWKFIYSMLFLPGVWDCRLRSGTRWLKPKRIYQVHEIDGETIAPPSFPKS